VGPAERTTRRTRIGLRDIGSLQPNQIIWDSSVTGFGARRQRSPAVAYVIFYRTADGRQRWHTIGRHGSPWTPDTARTEAKRVLGHVAKGEDPAEAKRRRRNAKTVAELCALYLIDAVSGRLLTRRHIAKKSSTLATDRGRIERHIKPLLGSLRVSSVTRSDVEEFMHAVAEGKTATRTKTKPRGVANVRGGKGAATRTVGLLGAILSYAVRHGMRSDNPVHGIPRFADGRRERRLNPEEYAEVGKALRDAQLMGTWPAAVMAARFLALTGWRSGEALGLKWSDLDLGRRTARLPDTKTGHSVRPLSRRACDVLRGLPQLHQLVFPATRGAGQMAGFRKIWDRILRPRGVPTDVTPHVLRHSFASLAADLGYSELTIAALIGHQGRTITSRYVHSADAVLLAAADAVADATAKHMGDLVASADIIPIRHEAFA
jgi:integrase